MSGIPKRDRKNKTPEAGKKEMTYEEVVAKIHKKDMTVKEIMMYLSQNNPLNDSQGGARGFTSLMGPVYKSPI